MGNLVSVREYWTLGSLSHWLVYREECHSHSGPRGHHVMETLAQVKLPWDGSCSSSNGEGKQGWRQYRSNRENPPIAQHCDASVTVLFPSKLPLSHFCMSYWTTYSPLMHLLLKPLTVQPHMFSLLVLTNPEVPLHGLLPSVFHICVHMRER